MPEAIIETRPRWTRDEVAALMALPFPELMFRAQTVHRAHFNPAEVQISTLLSIKTGGCPEDCGYCPQSASFETGTPASKLMAVQAVLEQAGQLKPPARSASAWVRPGAAQKSATWTPCVR